MAVLRGRRDVRRSDQLDVGSAGALAAILVVAITGKMVGAFAGARIQRLPKRQSAALAVLITTAMTGPLLNRIIRQGPVARDQAASSTTVVSG